MESSLVALVLCNMRERAVLLLIAYRRGHILLLPWDKEQKCTVAGGCSPVPASPGPGGEQRGSA